MKWVNTHRKGKKETIHSDVSFASSGNSQVPFPSQLVAKNTLLPIKVANEEAWMFYSPKKNDPGLLWKHTLENRGQQLQRADILGRFPLDGNAYHEPLVLSDNQSEWLPLLMN
ncbi:MAG: hypothetical protein ACK5V3_01715 [Bdellovibrionales bacterium]